MAQMIQELDLASYWMSMNIKDVYLDVPLEVSKWLVNGL